MERYGNRLGRIPPPGQAPIDPEAWIRKEQERRIRALQEQELRLRIRGLKAPAPAEPQAALEQQAPGPEPQAAGKKEAATGQGKARLSPRELADKHGVEVVALRKRLGRWRHEHDAGYVEVSNAAKNEPRYLYDESAVLPVIAALEAKAVARFRAADGQRKII